jgi:hypothetical protein
LNNPILQIIMDGGSHDESPRISQWSHTICEQQEQTRRRG